MLTHLYKNKFLFYLHICVVHVYSYLLHLNLNAMSFSIILLVRRLRVWYQQTSPSLLMRHVLNRRFNRRAIDPGWGLSRYSTMTGSHQRSVKNYDEFVKMRAIRSGYVPATPVRAHRRQTLMGGQPSASRTRVKTACRPRLPAAFRS